MSRRRRNPSQRYHDRVASRYEQVYGDAYWQWHDALTWDYLKPYLPSDLRAPVIDLGCGTGKWGRRLLKSGYGVTFVDSSHKMVEAARREVAENGMGERAEFRQADLVDLSALPQEHFALAVAMGEPIGCASDPARALREIAHALRSGGVLVATFDNRVACVDHYLEKRDLDALEHFLRTGRTHWLTRDRAEQFEIHTFEPQALHKLLTAAGFEVIEIVGKTVLPMRQRRELLEDAETRRRLARIEKRLARDPANLGRCPHLQLAARRR